MKILLILYITLQSIGLVADEKATFLKVKGAYESLKTYKADVKAEMAITDTVKVSLTGTVALRKPDAWKFRLVSDKTGGLIYYNLSNGTTHWTLDRSNMRILQAKVSPGAKPPLQFFPAFDELKTDEMMTNPGETEVEYRFPMKRTSDSMFAYLSLYVSKDDTLITSMVFRGAKGEERLRISFSNQTMNPKLEQTAFTFEKPKGLFLHVIKESNTKKQRK